MKALKKITLSGKLGKQFGEVHHFDVKNPAEAVRALCANFPGFEKFILDARNKNIGYKVFVANDNIDGSQLHDPSGKADIKIVPVVSGAKSGIGGILIGAALIGLSFALPGTALFTIGTFAPSLSSIAFGLGLNMALGGVSQMLSPQPKANKPQERPENQPSYTFNGAINTTAQGHCVPVGYGRLIVGSAVVSAGISADNYDGALSNAV